jgi:single-stranded DNA-binding protein
MNAEHLFIVGRATKDSEELTSKANKQFTKLRVAVNDYNSVTKEESVHYYDVLIFGKTSPKAFEAIKKGDTVVVHGKPEAEAYIPKKGKEPKVSITVLAESWKVLK